MSELMKIGDKIVVKPEMINVEYELISGKIYDLEYDRYRGEMYLKENGDFNLPKKIYHNEEDTLFVEKVLKYFKATTKQTTGILLNGVKGTGKTVMAKKLAIDSKLPIIIPSLEFPDHKLLEFFKGIKTDVCVMLDEIEKTRNTKQLLTFLDGVEATCKKLVIMTSNDGGKIDVNMFDRPSRIRYCREFTNNNSEYIKDIIADQGIIDTNNEIYNFIVTRFKTVSIDNIMSLLEEIKIFGDSESLDNLLKYLNIIPSNGTDVENVISNLSPKGCDCDDDDDDVTELLCEDNF